MEDVLNMEQLRHAIDFTWLSRQGETRTALSGDDIVECCGTDRSSLICADGRTMIRNGNASSSTTIDLCGVNQGVL